MKKISVLAVTIVLSTASAGIAFADTGHGHGANAPNAGPGAGMKGGGHNMMNGGGHNMMNGGGHNMMQMMMRMHAGMMGGTGMGQMGMMGNGGMSGMMGPMMAKFDADGDGKVTSEEAHGQLQAMHSSFDANGDSTLSIDEFEMLHSSMIREAMVDRFQHLDADGDGKVTAGEMTAPADKMERMTMMRGNMKPGAMMGGTDMSKDEN